MFDPFKALRKRFSTIVVLFSVLWLAACQSVSVSNVLPGGGGSASGPVTVALLVPHGAANPNEQQLAKDLENAARLAVSDLQGVQVDLRVYGTAGSAGKAQQVALKAVSDGAQIIVGPLHAESANAVAVAVAPSGVNVLAFSNNPTIAGGNLFILGQTFQNTANRLVSFATGQGKSRILTVYSNNLAGQLGKAAIQQAIAANGAASAGSVGYEFSQAGVVSAVPQIKATAEANNADAVFLTANTAGALPLFSQMLPEAGLSPAQMQFIGLARWDTPAQTLDLPGVQGGWFALPDTARHAQFSGRFRSAYGNSPHAIAGLAYDGVAAVGALARSGGRKPLGRDALTQGAGFQGVNGVFRFRSDGTNQRGLAVATIRDKKVIVISPAPQSFRGAGF